MMKTICTMILFLISMLPILNVPAGTLSWHDSNGVKFLKLPTNGWGVDWNACENLNSITSYVQGEGMNLGTFVDVEYSFEKGDSSVLNGIVTFKIPTSNIGILKFEEPFNYNLNNTDRRFQIGLPLPILQSLPPRTDPYTLSVEVKADGARKLTDTCDFKVKSSGINMYDALDIPMSIRQLPPGMGHPFFHSYVSDNTKACYWFSQTFFSDVGGSAMQSGLLRENKSSYLTLEGISNPYRIRFKYAGYGDEGDSYAFYKNWIGTSSSLHNIPAMELQKDGEWYQSPDFLVGLKKDGVQYRCVGETVAWNYKRGSSSLKNNDIHYGWLDDIDIKLLRNVRLVSNGGGYVLSVWAEPGTRFDKWMPFPDGPTRCPRTMFGVENQYVFAGWYDNVETVWDNNFEFRSNGCGNLVTGLSIVPEGEYEGQPIRLYARWIRKTPVSVPDVNNCFEVLFDAKGGTVSPVKMYIQKNTEIGVLPVPFYDGYSFVGWFTSGGAEVSASTRVTGNVTYYAKWIAGVNKIYCTLMLDPTGGTVSLLTKDVEIGVAVGELPEPVRKGYSFAGWYTSQVGGERITCDSVVDENAVLYARWIMPGVDIGFVKGAGLSHPLIVSSSPTNHTSQTEFVEGDSIYFNCSFMNVGGNVDVGAFTNRFSLSSDARYDVFCAGLKSNTVGLIGDAPLILQDLKPGRYEFTCVLDVANALAEVDESNNQLTIEFIVKSSDRPNITIPSMSISKERVTLSESVTVHWRVTNNGKGSAEKSKMAFLTYKCDTASGNRTLVKTEWLDCLPLAAGGSQEFKKTITGKSLGEGSYSFVVVADGQENIVERDETDNVGAVATEVGKDNATSSKSSVDWQFNKIKGEADSFFLSASSDMKKKATTFKVGQPIYMRCCWWNAKKGAVSGNAMRVRVVMNGSPGVYTDRSYFEKDYYYYFSSKNPDFLQNLPAGNYTLTAVLDSENTWVESNEKNNVKTISFTVVGTPKIFCEAIYHCALNEPVSWPVTIDGKATLTGLPSGLKYSDGAISGKATKTGTYTVNISTKNDAGSATKTLTIQVEDPGFIVSCSAQSNGSSIASNVVSGGTVEMYAGVNQVITLTSIPGKADVASADATVTAKGLPVGLKLSGGKITGVPTKAGTYAVNVSFKNKLSWTSSFLLNIVVHPLPDWAVGNFEGFVSLDENDGGFATMSVTAAGKISGKISYGGTNWTFNADSFAVASETVGYTNLALRTVATSGKATLNLSLNMVDFLVDSLPSSTTSFAEGYFGEVYTMMYRLPWKDKNDADAASLIASYAGAYSCKVPYGDDSGDVTFVLDEKGAVKGTVILPDGAKTRKATFSCNVLPNYDSLSVVIALPPDAKKGYPAVFKVVNLVNHSGEGADDLAFRDPGVVAAVSELTAESGATGTVSVNPKYGQVAPGKDVTLTAKAAKGSVFHRWEITGVDTEGLDLSSSTLKIKMTDTGDVFAKAVFVTAEEDAASIALSVDALGGEISSEAIISVTNTCGVSLKWSVAADALSKTTVAVSGLPAGLKFTAKDIMKKGSKTEVDIPANTIYGAPTAESKLDAKTGLRKPSAVKFTVTTAGKSKRVYSVDMTILPLPDWAVGNFEGFVRYDENDGGFATMNITAAGKVSGKIAYGGTNWTFKADSYDITSETVGYTNFAVKAVAASGKATLDFSLAITKDGVDYLPDSAVAFGDGNFGDMPAEMHRLPWKDKDDAKSAALIASYAGAYSCKVPYCRDAAGVTFVLDEKGAVKGTVVLPDGTKTRKATFSCNVLPNYDSFSVVIALPPDLKKGYPAVFKIVELVNCSGEGSDGMAYRDPGVIVKIPKYFYGSGTVTVSPKYGQVSSGNSVTVTAKPDKGSVFRCWEIEGADTDGLNLTSPTLKFVMTGEKDVYATAVFATVKDDIASFSFSVPNRVMMPDEKLSIDLQDYVFSLSQPKFTVSGLPVGLKYDSKTMTISGAIAKKGTYAVMVTATNASATGKNAIVCEFIIKVQEPEPYNGYAPVSDFEWVYTSCGVEITKYLGEDSNVKIPFVVDNLPVVSIGKSAFRYSKTLMSVTIPDGVASIGSSAFYGCAYLEHVSIADSVTSIGIAAFDDCPNLESINIPKGVSVINESLFSKCHSLKSIVIPEGVTGIGESAFYHCNSLTELVIPNSVTNIDSGAFAYCSSLTNVIREGNGAISVGGGAFADCPGLINDDEFFIVMDVLCGYFGEGGDVVIPEGVTSIAENVFFWCDSLTSVTIPDSVAVIGSGAFKECPGLADEDGFVIVKGILFDYFGEGGNVVIPQGVVKIDSGAFEREDGPVEIKNIVIPESVTSIEEYAFESSLLTEIVFLGNAPILCGDVFYDVNENCTAYVRPGSIGWGVTIPGVWNNIYITYEALR